MSRLQVAFTVHNLSTGDENDYGLHVELGLARNPLKDAVALRLEGNIIFLNNVNIILLTIIYHQFSHDKCYHIILTIKERNSVLSEAYKLNIKE